VLTAMAGASLMLTPRTASIVSILVARLDSITSPTNPYDDRPAIWAEATSQFLELPLFGVGPSGYTAASVAEDSVLHARPAEHAHNLLLVMASEQGILGIILLVAVIASGVLGAVRLLRRRGGAARGLEGPLLAGVCAALLSVLGQGLIDFPLRNPVAGTTVWLVVGLLAALSVLHDRSPRRAAATPQDVAVPVA
jgi:putative inorganic carbon (HCO3(-)) transporter